MSDWQEERDEALRTLDIEWALAKGAPNREVALISLHKSRYEVTSMAPSLRAKSREWLESRGYSRVYGLPWPEDEKLPT